MTRDQRYPLCSSSFQIGTLLYNFDQKCPARTFHDHFKFQLNNIAKPWLAHKMLDYFCNKKISVTATDDQGKYQPRKLKYNLNFWECYNFRCILRGISAYTICMNSPQLGCHDGWHLSLLSSLPSSFLYTVNCRV